MVLRFRQDYAHWAIRGIAISTRIGSSAVTVTAEQEETIQ